MILTKCALYNIDTAHRMDHGIELEYEISLNLRSMGLRRRLMFRVDAIYNALQENHWSLEHDLHQDIDYS